MVDIYTPNSKRELERLDYRQIWEDEIRKYLLELNQKKPVIMCGDLNVAHKEIDLKNPKTNRRNAGFTDEERNKMTELLEAGFIDTFRYLYPEKTDCYSWWSYMGRAREKNVGWRIDYFITSKDIKEKIKEQNQYLENKRIDGHVYEVGEKYSGRIWLYDLNNISGGGIEGVEEIKIPKDLYETAKEGDLFIYENGEYKKHE